VGSEHSIVGLDNSGGALGGWVDTEEHLGFAAVVNREALQKERGEATSSTTAEGVEYHETLETSALICLLAKAVEDKVHNLLADGVVTAGVVVGCIFFTRDQLLGVEKLAVGTGADLVDDSWLEIEEDCAGHVLAGSSLREEGSERVVVRVVIGFFAIASNWLLAVRLDAVFQAEQFPASVTKLNTSLADVNKKALAHFQLVFDVVGRKFWM